MSNLDIAYPSQNITVSLKLWGKDKADGGWVLIDEINDSKLGEIPKIYAHNTQYFKLQEKGFVSKGKYVASYTEIRAVNLCSKCHVRIKAPPSFPVRHFDHWCDRCYTEIPLAERSRKCSRGEKKKLIEEQQRAIDKRAVSRSVALAEQELKQMEAAKNKSVATPRKKSKKDSDVAFLLDLDFAESVVECEPLVEDLDYDVLRQRIAEEQDPSIFDEDLLDD